MQERKQKLGGCLLNCHKELQNLVLEILKLIEFDQNEIFQKLDIGLL